MSGRGAFKEHQTRRLHFHNLESSQKWFCSTGAQDHKIVVENDMRSVMSLFTILSIIVTIARVVQLVRSKNSKSQKAEFPLH
jgi:hypothetical protein